MGIDASVVEAMGYGAIRSIPISIMDVKSRPDLSARVEAKTTSSSPVARDALAMLRSQAKNNA